MIEMNRKKKCITVPVNSFSYTSKIQSLASSACPAFFPASVILDGNLVHIHYSVEGFRPLRVCRNLSSVQVLNLTKSVLKNIVVCREWLWFPDDYIISADTVWINSGCEVKFLCIPEQKGCCGSKRFCGLLHSMSHCTDEVGTQYLKRLYDLTEINNLPPSRLISEIDQMMAEVRSYSRFTLI